MRPHLLVLDLRIPRMSGASVLAHARNTPAIVLSASAGELPPELAARSNVKARLQKPVGADALHEAVRNALGRVAGDRQRRALLP